MGIDPGSRFTGFAVIELKANEPRPVCLLAGCLRLIHLEGPQRLGKLFLHVRELVQQFNPEELAIEQIFMHKSAQSALKLGQARGVAIAASVIEGLAVYEYAAKRVKQAVVGTGTADKKQVQHMIQVLFGLSEKPQADAADALAVAWCHLQAVKNPLRAHYEGVAQRRIYKRVKQWVKNDSATTR